MVLPFTRDAFLAVFAAYNHAIWPLQLAASGLGVIAVALLLWRPRSGGRGVSGVLVVLWSGMALGYHWTYFSTINRAAYLFGALFLSVALLMLVEGVIRGRASFDGGDRLGGWIAAVLVAYAMVVYPLIGLLVTHPYPETPLFGVAPCPTTIFTLGLLLRVRHPHPFLLAAVPLAWSVVGGSAALLLTIPQDWALLAAGPLWVIVRLRRARGGAPAGYDRTT